MKEKIAKKKRDVRHCNFQLTFYAPPFPQTSGLFSASSSLFRSPAPSATRKPELKKLLRAQ